MGLKHGRHLVSFEPGHSGLGCRKEPRVGKGGPDKEVAYSSTNSLLPPLTRWEGRATTEERSAAQPLGPPSGCPGLWALAARLSHVTSASLAPARCPAEWVPPAFAVGTKT